MADLIDRIELMRQIAEFGREIPKDQVMEVIARMEAVETEGDLISRETAIKILAAHYAKKLMDFGYKSYEEADTLEKMYCDGVSDAMNIVDTLPSADRPKGECLLGTEMSLSKWIPVSERLPSEKKAVLICDSGGNRFVGKLVLTDYGYKWSARLFRVWIDIEDGDAWMPLPEPYKGGEDE